MDELIYVIAGKEDSLVNARCRELLDELLEPEQRATGLFDAEAASVSVSEVLDELRTVPFLTDKRIVLIKSADKFISENRPFLEKYFDKPCPTGQLIFTVRTWEARTNLAKKLSNVGKLIKVTQPKRSELPQRLIINRRNSPLLGPSLIISAGCLTPKCCLKRVFDKRKLQINFEYGATKTDSLPNFGR